MGTPFRSTKHKSFKEKLQELKELARGKKTLDSLIKANQPGKFYTVEVLPDGYYEVQEGNKDKQVMTKEQYEQWRASEREAGPKDFILWLEKAEGCAPIIDKDEVSEHQISEVKGTYDYDISRSHILEFQDYSGKNRTIQVDIVKSTQ